MRPARSRFMLLHIECSNIFNIEDWYQPTSAIFITSGLFIMAINGTDSLKTSRFVPTVMYIRSYSTALGFVPG